MISIVNYGGYKKKWDKMTGRVLKKDESNWVIRVMEMNMEGDREEEGKNDKKNFAKDD